MPVNFEVYMLRDKNTGRWHNWGGMAEWYTDTDRGGTFWLEKDKAQEFADNYNSKKIGVVVEVVTLTVRENQPWFVGALNDSAQSSD